RLSWGRRRGLCERRRVWPNHQGRRQGRAAAHSIAARMTGGLRGGDVILLHDADHYSARGSWRQTVAALPRILEAIERQTLKDKAKGHFTLAPTSPAALIAHPRALPTPTSVPS